MFCRFSFFILILSLNYRITKQEMNKNNKQFYCDTNEIKNEILNLKIKRFFINFDQIYLISNDKIIFFKMPIIEENFYFDKLFKNETLLVLEEPIYYQEMSENSKSSSVERRDEESFELNLDYRIIGYIYDEHINVGMKRIYEIDVKKELKEILFDQNGRPRIKRFEIDLFNLYDYLNLIKKEDFINSDHQTNILVTKTDFFLIKYYSIGPKTTEILYKFCRFLNHTINCLDSITQELNGEVKFLVFRIQDFLEFNKIDRTDKIIDLIQIETGNKIHFKRKHFTIFENTLKVNKEYSQSISYMVEDLFGCYGKFKNANDVKGLIWIVVVLLKCT